MPNQIKNVSNSNDFEKLEQISFNMTIKIN